MAATFGDYKATGRQWITSVEGEFYPDYLEQARVLFSDHLTRFAELANTGPSSAELLRRISNEPTPVRNQLLRIFRRYVHPSSPVEGLKRKSSIEAIIASENDRFRPITEVRQALASRPYPDDVLIALLYENKDRGKKGYQLTSTFFAWFEEHLGEGYVIQGPQGAGRDVMLDDVLPRFDRRLPADFLISRPDGTPLVVGFARYDSDRGGSQEDDRTGSNRDNSQQVLTYAREHGVPLKVLFINDGPGLLLGSMWNDYATLEARGDGRIMVCTLKMLPERLTREWLER